MTTLVVVGSTTTKYVSSGDGRRLMVTPRDYHWMDGHVCSEARKNYTHKDLPRADEETYLSKPPVHSTRMSKPINDTKDSK